MRYFLTKPREEGSSILSTRSKDLRTELTSEEPDNLKFLHQYMTLTRCDLFFADAAILVEGTSERLILPKAIEKFDIQNGRNIGGKYLSIMEVGGAYAHLFYHLIDFLELRTLVITDLDAVEQTTADSGKTRWTKCPVSKGRKSSNTSINRWFDPSGENSPAIRDLLSKSSADKAFGCRRIAFQIPHLDGGACGRSFEDAFILANTDKFTVNGSTVQEMETHAWDMSLDIKKSEFALKYAINETDWVIPRYIEEGLRWLGQIDETTLPLPADGEILPAAEEQADV